MSTKNKKSLKARFVDWLLEEENQPVSDQEAKQSAPQDSDEAEIKEQQVEKTAVSEDTDTLPGGVVKDPEVDIVAPPKQDEPEEEDDEENEGDDKSNFLAAVIVIGMIVLLALGITKCQANQPTKSVDLDSKGSDEAILQVQLDELHLKKYEHISSLFLEDSMPWNNQERVAVAGFSDATGFPIINLSKRSYSKQDIAAMRENITERIFRDPVYGDMVGQGLAELKISSGKKLGEYLPWLLDVPNKFTQAIKDGNGVAVFLEYQGEELHVIKDYRVWAASTVAVLDLMLDEGTKPAKTLRNWHLPFAAKASQTRTTEAPYQESKPCLVLLYKNKANKTMVRIGFNLADGRFEILTKNPKKPNPPKHPGKPNPGNPGKPGKPDPKKPKKDPGKDPVNKGNAPIGGGKNDIPGDGTYEPANATTPPSDQVIVVPETWNGTLNNLQDLTYIPPVEGGHGDTVHQGEPAMP